MPTDLVIDCATGQATTTTTPQAELDARATRRTEALALEAADATAAGNAATIGGKLDAALAANATYLALASPTAAQTAAQVKALTRQVTALIRLTRRALADTTGT